MVAMEFRPGLSWGACSAPPDPLAGREGLGAPPLNPTYSALGVSILA